MTFEVTREGACKHSYLDDNGSRPAIPLKDTGQATANPGNRIVVDGANLIKPSSNYDINGTVSTDGDTVVLLVTATMNKDEWSLPMVTCFDYRAEIRLQKAGQYQLTVYHDPPTRSWSVPEDEKEGPVIEQVFNLQP